VSFMYNEYYICACACACACAPGPCAGPVLALVHRHKNNWLSKMETSHKKIKRSATKNFLMFDPNGIDDYSADAFVEKVLDSFLGHVIGRSDYEGFRIYMDRACSYLGSASSKFPSRNEKLKIIHTLSLVGSYENIGGSVQYLDLIISRIVDPQVAMAVHLLSLRKMATYYGSHYSVEIHDTSLAKFKEIAKIFNGVSRDNIAIFNAMYDVNCYKYLSYIGDIVASNNKDFYDLERSPSLNVRDGSLRLEEYNDYFKFISDRYLQRVLKHYSIGKEWRIDLMRSIKGDGTCSRCSTTFDDSLHKLYVNNYGTEVCELCLNGGAAAVASRLSRLSAAATVKNHQDLTPERQLTPHN
jgi:hypothetical protein